MKTKICNKCHIEKDIDLFKTRTSNKDGKTSICKKCASDYSILYQKINKEKNSDKRKVICDNYRKNNIP